MEAIRVRRTLDSETLHLPELRPLMGRQVEIIVLAEESPSACIDKAIIVPGTGDWAAFERAAQELREGGFDFDFLKDFDAIDLRHEIGQAHDPD